MPKQPLPDLLRRSIILSVPCVALFTGLGVAVDKIMMVPPVRYIQNWTVALHQELSREQGEPKFSALAMPAGFSPAKFKDSVGFEEAREIQKGLFQEFYTHLTDASTPKSIGIPKPEKIKEIIDVLNDDKFRNHPELAIDQAIDLMEDVSFRIGKPTASVKFRPVFLVPPVESAYVAELRKDVKKGLEDFGAKCSELRTVPTSRLSRPEEVKEEGVKEEEVKKSIEKALILIAKRCRESREIYIKLCTIDDGSGRDRDLQHQFVKFEKHLKRATVRLAESIVPYPEDFGRSHALLLDYSHNMQARIVDIERRMNL